MTDDILATLRTDHANMVKVLDVLESEIEQFAGGGQPDLEIVGAAATYLLDYPDRFHHPLEDALLERLRHADPAAAEKMAGLEEEHARIAVQTKQFYWMVRNIMSDEPARRDDLCALGRELISTLRNHMRHEELDFFPQAEVALSKAELAAAAASIPPSHDPMFGAADRDAYARLRGTIIEWAQA